MTNLSPQVAREIGVMTAEPYTYSGVLIVSGDGEVLVRRELGSGNTHPELPGNGWACDNCSGETVRYELAACYRGRPDNTVWIACHRCLTDNLLAADSPDTYLPAEAHSYRA